MVGSVEVGQLPSPRVEWVQECPVIPGHEPLKQIVGGTALYSMSLLTFWKNNVGRELDLLFS